MCIGVKLIQNQSMKREVAALEAGFSVENVRFTKPGDSHVFSIIKQTVPDLCRGSLRFFAEDVQDLNALSRNKSKRLGFYLRVARNTRRCVQFSLGAVVRSQCKK